MSVPEGQHVWRQVGQEEQGVFRCVHCARRWIKNVDEWPDRSTCERPAAPMPIITPAYLREQAERYARGVTSGTITALNAAAAELERLQAVAEGGQDARRAVGNCGYIDPLGGTFEEDEGKPVPPWWVPLLPETAVTEAQGWAAFLSWWCQPRMFVKGERGRTARWERWHDLTFDLTYSLTHPEATP